MGTPSYALGVRPSPVIFHLVGYPGVGKRTIASEMERLAAEAGQRLVVVDNHLSGNPVLSVLDLAAGSPPPEAWGLVYEIREVVIRAIERHSPRDWSFVFTNVLTDNGDSDLASVRRLRRLADARASTYRPTVLTCDVDELVRRAGSPGRSDQLKLTDPEVVRSYVGTRALHHPPGANVLDVTGLPPEAAARALLHGGRLLP
jgi:hypothetical protein